MKGLGCFIALFCGIGGICHAAGPAYAQDELRVFLKSHCVDCHSGSSAERELDLSSLNGPVAQTESLGSWSMIHDRVAKHEMPPDDHEQPDADERAAFLSTLAKSLTNADLARQVEHGRGVVRRLNRVEFENTLSDLLSVPLRIRDLLPPDAKGAGFDTVGAALNVSAVQMESYLQAIDVALDDATKLIEQPPVKKWRLSYLQTHGMMEEYRRSGPHTPEPDGIAMFAPDFFSHMNSLLDTWVTPHSARYRVRVAARALRSKEPITVTVRMGGP